MIPRPSSGSPWGKPLARPEHRKLDHQQWPPMAPAPSERRNRQWPGKDKSKGSLSGGNNFCSQPLLSATVVNFDGISGPNRRKM